MTKADKTDEILSKVIMAMEKVKDKLIEYKRAKKSDLVIIKNGKVVRIKP